MQAGVRRQSTWQAYTHTHTHTHTHTRTHTHTHKCVREHAHTHTHTHAFTLTSQPPHSLIEESRLYKTSWPGMLQPIGRVPATLLGSSNCTHAANSQTSLLRLLEGTLASTSTTPGHSPSDMLRASK